VGEAECDDGVRAGRLLGETADGWVSIGGGRGETPGSSFGAMLELDLRE